MKRKIVIWCKYPLICSQLLHFFTMVIVKLCLMVYEL